MANIALIGWPVVAMILFSTLPFRNAVIWSVLLAYLFLPEKVGFNFPGLPALNKTSIPALTLLFCVLAFGQKAGRIGMPGSGETRLDRGGIIKGLIWVLTVGLLAAPLLTVLGNLDGTWNGGLFQPGLRLWDVVNIVFANAMLIVPYFLARRYLSTPEAHRILVRALVLIGFAYSLLAIVEVRLSPQLNMWVYGYYQHSFAQHVRDGGFRPMLFVEHGLSVGFLLFSVVLAAATLYRARKAGADPIQPARKYLLAGIWIFGVLLLSRNLGAAALAFLFAPAVLLLGTRWQVRIAAITAIVFLAYPAVRQADLVPTERITSIAANISESRAASYQFRLDNEDILLERALQRPLVGWGGWGRSRVYDESGRDLSVTDGIWIIILGSSGWIGYVAFFGFLTFPIILLWRMSRHREIPYETAGLAVIMAGNFIYMIPNSTLSPIGWLMAGALAGYVQFEPVRNQAPEPAAADSAPREARYTRFRGAGARRPVTRRSRSV